MNFSEKSKQKLETCHQDLQMLFNEVIKDFDCTIVCGHRNKEDQDEAYRTGRSKQEWPNSKHNKTPSLAVDVAPCKNGKIDWNDKELFYYFAGFVMGTATHLGINIRYGGDWNGNNNLEDQNFNDLPHFEL